MAAEPQEGVQTIRTVLARRVRQVRGRHGWSQERLAEQLESLGVRLHPTAIVKIERGTRGVSVDEALALAAALNVSPDVLLLPREDVKIALTPRLVASSDKIRRWFAGRSLLMDSHQADGPSWPPQPETTDEQDERFRFWRSERPLSELRAFEREGVAHLVNEVTRFVRAAGQDTPRRTVETLDRLEMQQALLAIQREVDRQLEAIDLADPDQLMREAITQTRDLLQTSAAAAEGQDQQDDEATQADKQPNHRPAS
jgi:transcriptional regulator with XRE-family HTH domain